MARVGEEFPFACPGCGGDIRFIAFITEPGPIRKILTHLGEPLEPPPVSPARETGARAAPAAHQLGNGCGRAIGRAILCCLALGVNWPSDPSLTSAMQAARDALGSADLPA